MTLAMASQSRCSVTAGGDRSSSPVNGFADSEANVASASERAFLIGVAGGTASGKVFVFFFSSGRTFIAFMIAPSCSNIVSRKVNIIIKDALLQFISRNGMKL